MTARYNNYSNYPNNHFLAIFKSDHSLGSIGITNTFKANVESYINVWKAKQEHGSPHIYAI